MWKASAGTQINLKNCQDNEADDDWETDPDFINDVSEQEQRWGSRTVEGSGRNAGAIDMEKLRKETEQSDAKIKKKQLDEGANSSFGYGGKFGVEADRMDRSAVGHDYVAKLEKHVSQKDYSTGFGGKFGVQTDRVDKSAVSWDHKEKIEKHSSQKDYVSGFGGKFGVQSDRQDQSAVGWDYVEKMNKHESQKDYALGFGGKFGVQHDRQDKSAVGWDHHEAPQKHESQIDHKVGFGGKFGVQTDRMDKSAVSFSDESEKVGTVYTKEKADVGAVNPTALRAKFENMQSTEQKSDKPNLKTAPRQLSQTKTAIFNQSQQTKTSENVVNVPPKLDISKTEIFTKQTEFSEPETQERRKLDSSKMAAFTERKNEESLERNQGKKMEEIKNTLFNKASSCDEKNSEVKHEQKQQEINKADTTAEKNIDPNLNEPTAIIDKTEEGEETEVVLEDTGLTAIALYDYQAAADDEITFDPDDIITHVEMIDDGWWRGLCRNQYGLFPANYVQLQQ